MTRDEFICELEKSLSSLSDEERKSALQYYNELLDDAGPENEKCVIDGFGSPKDVADNIIRENGVNVDTKSETSNLSEKDNSGSKKGDNVKRTRLLLFLVLILTSPLWGGIAMSILGAVFGLIIAVAGVLFAFCVAAVACFFVGIGLLFVYLPAGIIMMGIGLILGSLVVLIVFPVTKAIFMGLKYCFAGIGRAIKTAF